MLETREWPASLRRSARVLLTLIYVGCGGAGLHVAWPVLWGGEHGTWWAVLLGGVAFASAALALVMMLVEFWGEEHVAAWVLSIVFGCYLAVDTLRLVFGSGADVGGTMLLLVCTAAVGLRIVNLRATRDRWYIERRALLEARAARP